MSSRQCTLLLQYIVLFLSAVSCTDVRCSNEGTHDVHLAFASEANVRASHSVALATHGSLDRVPAVERWCRTWRGPMHVAFVIAPAYACRNGVCRVESTHRASHLTQFWKNESGFRLVPMSEQEAAIREAFDRSDCFRRWMTAHVVRPSHDELVSAQEYAQRVLEDLNKTVNASPPQRETSALRGWDMVHGAHNPQLHYPVNVARNAAIEGARLAGHHLHFTVDADLSLFNARNSDCDRLSQMAWDTLAKLSQPVSQSQHHPGPDMWPWLAWTRKIIVVPAVEVDGRGDVPLPRSVGDLLTGSVIGVRPFYDLKFYPYNLTSLEVGFVGPAPFSFGRWGGDFFHMEPFHIASTYFAHPYDERFLGRHGDKISWFQRVLFSSAHPGTDRERYELLQMSDTQGPLLVNYGRGDAPDTRRSESDSHMQNIVGNQALLDRLALRAHRIDGFSVPRDLWQVVHRLFAQLNDRTSRLGLTRYCTSDTACISSATFSHSQSSEALSDAEEIERLRGHACTADYNGLCDMLTASLVPQEPRHAVSWLRSMLFHEKRRADSVTAAAITSAGPSVPPGRVVRCDGRPVVCIPWLQSSSEEELRHYLAALCGDQSPRRHRQRTAWNCPELISKALNDSSLESTLTVNATIVLTLSSVLESAYEIDAGRRCFAGGLGAAVLCVSAPTVLTDVPRFCRVMVAPSV